MLIEPVGLELTELYAPVPRKKKPGTEKYIIRQTQVKQKSYKGIRSKLKRMRKKIRSVYFG